MRANHLRTLLNEGKPTFGTRVQSSWPYSIEIIGRSGQFDYVEFLAEYAPWDLYALDNMGRAIELSENFSGMIKMEQSAQWHLAVRAMSAGIQNLLFTDVRSKADAEAIVRLVRPEGPGNDYTHGMAGGRIQVSSQADYYTNLGVKDFNLSSDVAILRQFFSREGGALRERVEQAGK